MELPITRRCYYCGQPADTVDHTIPRSLLRQLAAATDLIVFHDRRRRWTVPACAECNGLLSSTVLDTLAARKEHVRQRLQARYARLLAAPAWTGDELAELGPSLRPYIEGLTQLRQAIRRRIGWTPPAMTATPVRSTRGRVVRTQTATRRPAHAVRLITKRCHRCDEVFSYPETEGARRRMCTRCRSHGARMSRLRAQRWRAMLASDRDTARRLHAEVVRLDDEFDRRVPPSPFHHRTYTDADAESWLRRQA